MPVVVLPDLPLPAGLEATIIEQAGPVLFRHPSGAPWIIGDPHGRRIRHGRNRHVEVVLIGNDSVDAGESELAHLLGNLTSVRDLDAVAAALAEGDVLLFARDQAGLRSQTPVFLTRSLCWTTAGDVTLISDDQLTLREIAGLSADPAVLASRLTDAELSYPFGIRSIWRGLNTIGPGEWLDSRADQPPVRIAWWRAPEPGGTVNELAGRLRDDIFAALRRRTAHHPAVSADLSGGLDSTTLTFFLAGLGRTPTTLFLSSANEANVDHRWAGRAVAELGSDHRVAPYLSVIPILVDPGVGTVAGFPEGPSMGSLTVASVSMIEGILAGSGSTVHLNGHAGDALFGPVSTMLWSLVHSREKRRFRRSWRYRVVNKLPLGRTIRMVARRGTYLDDLRRIAADDFHRRDDAVASQSRWLPLPKVHPALTGAARGHLRDLAAEAIRTDQRQLAAGRTTHEILQYLLVHGNDVRRMNQAASPAAGIHFDSPYLDRRVVETSLALRIGERTQQYPAKPLLAAARPAEMSLEYFTRRDKGDYSREVFDQHQALKPLLKELFSDGSALADAGLVDPDRVLRSANEFSMDGSAYTDLEYIAFAERWLRSAAAGPTRKDRRW